MSTTMKAIAILIFLASIPALAAEDGQLSLSPAVVMLRGDFGQSTTQTLTLRNGTSRAFSFELVAQDVVITGGKRRFADAGSIPGSIATTAVFSPRLVHVPPGESVTVAVTVTLPAETEQRAVVALFRATHSVMSGNVPVVASLGSLLSFTVSDDLTMDAAPLEVRPQSRAANLAVTHPCRNSGREPFVVRGTMAILDDRGALVGKSAIAPKRLLPGETSDLGAEHGGELQPGRYRIFITYDYEGRTLSREAEVEVEVAE